MPPLPDTLAGVTGYLVVTAPLAAVADVMIRHPAGTVATLLSWYLLAGPTLRARVPDTAGWLPDTTGAWTVALAWTAPLVIPGLVTFTRRDA